LRLYYKRYNFKLSVGFCPFPVKMDLRKIEWGGMDWIDLAQDRDQWRALVNGNEPSGSIICWKILE
jgi:hypothetical protein